MLFRSIARRYADKPAAEDDFARLAAGKIAPKIELAKQFLENKTGCTPQEIRTGLGNRMSAHAAHIRKAHDVRKAKDDTLAQLQHIAEQTVLASPDDLIAAFENVDLLMAQYVYTAAMENYITTGGGSRGSYIIPGENEHTSGIPDFLPNNEKLSERIQEVCYRVPNCDFIWEDVRPIPESDYWFENVWREYRNDEVIR